MFKILQCKIFILSLDYIIFYQQTLNFNLFKLFSKIHDFKSSLLIFKWFFCFWFVINTIIISSLGCFGSMGWGVLAGWSVLLGWDLLELLLGSMGIFFMLLWDGCWKVVDAKWICFASLLWFLKSDSKPWLIDCQLNSKPAGEEQG